MAVLLGSLVSVAIGGPVSSSVVRAENCGPGMPPRIAFARGYMFSGTLTAMRPETQRLAEWRFSVDEAFHGLGDIDVGPVRQTMEPGTTMTLHGLCYPPQGLKVGHRYLVSDATPLDFSSMSAVVWEFLPRDRVRLLRQYGSRNMDPRIAGPTTVAEAVRLMAPPFPYVPSKTCASPEVSPAPTSGPVPSSAPASTPGSIPSPASSAGPAVVQRSAEPADAPMRKLGGTWRPMARSPFPSQEGAGVWTGHRAIMVSPGARLAASYDPETDLWRRLPRPPPRFPQLGDAFWTGSEAIFVGGSRLGIAPTVGVAYDPHAAKWRRLPVSPLEDYESSVWAGGMVVVAATEGGSARDAIAGYDVAGDCWLILPNPPISTAWRLIGAGDRLVAWGSAWPAHASPTISIMDMTSRTWGPPTTLPLDRDAGTPVWIGGDELMVLREPSDDPDGDRAGTFDLAAGIWMPFDAACPVYGNVWTGQVLLGYRNAYDPEAHACYRVPRSHDRNRREPVSLWTGRELILWSGGGGEELPALPDGVIYRPPAWVTRPEVHPVGRGMARL